MATTSEERDTARGDQKAQESESEGEDAAEVLEESPDKRWEKRREQVKQRDVPGIDCAYLAMDNETGNEVVWNEVQFSERKNFRAQEEKINAVFDNLTQLVHPNLVKFHKYWTDAKSEKPRIIFITEYMSSGSMSLFLQRTRKSGSPLSIKAWKKWATQILSALNYLHSSSPPIIHGNLTCHTIFIQQNGLIKIGCGINCSVLERCRVAPEAINHHVKTCRNDNWRNMHYMAPELEYCKEMTPAADIYSFGICALEIAAAGGLISQNGTTEGTISEECIQKALASIEDPSQKDLIAKCLRRDPTERPSARQLLFHPVLFEVHSLKLLSAHTIVANKLYEDVNEEVLRIPDHDKVVVSCAGREMAYCQLPHFQFDLDKFLEDVRNGIFPLTAFAPLAHPPTYSLDGEQNPTPSTTRQTREESEPQQRSTKSTSAKPSSAENSTVATAAAVASSSAASKPSGATTSAVEPPTEEDTAQNETFEESPHEPRSVVHMKALLDGRELTILLKLEDGMNRHLSTEIAEDEQADALTEELLRGGFICDADGARVRHLLESVLNPPPVSAATSVPAVVSLSASLAKAMPSAAFASTSASITTGASSGQQ